MFDIYCCEEHSATDYKGAATIVRITLLSSREYCDRVLESLPACEVAVYMGAITPLTL